MTKLKVMTIIGTRPEIIRLSATIKRCDEFFNQVLVHTGQNWDYSLNEVFFEDLELRKPDHFLNVVGNHLGETMGNIIEKSYEVMKKEKPDALLILGDTNSCLAAISAKRLKIPVFHMEAGNRCYDQNVPEEINRKIVDHTSDINLTYTEHSRRNLISEGIRKDHIMVTGSPMAEVLKNQQGKINSSNILAELNLEQNNYMVLSAHREENIDNKQNFNQLIDSINYIAKKFDKKIVFSAHPRTWKKIEENNVELNKNIMKLKPFGFNDYNALQKNAYCVLSDSGTLSEESSILSFPGVLIRTSTERPEVLDKGSIVISGLNKETIENSINIASNSVKYEEITKSPVDYQDENVSIKVVKIIQSYTSIINREIWRKA
ncbi:MULTISPECIES: UDP-N-acetylglucosamine 2-epimerase (non-hydrolyzing) [unclassified Exiguobacterium]|uniref:non-hydrolyzing UDP-N-acetylglucosamine 2-epimerase n=1 Tax=unclassified Exiguobacterium TaxID=2644629 RepID=UPI001BED0474|nr:MULTISPECIES: UDP-N-acetylglucosamine 2-epimerase (non-hydrolyzing) [unclassified Exiguobacterium]